MEEQKKVLIDMDKNIVGQLEKTIPYAANILLRSLMGLPVNRDLVKDAKFSMSNLRGLLILAKENRKVDSAEKRFNFKVLDEFGTEAEKKQIKSLFSKSFKKMKFIEK